jgi:hypothetical protein
MDLLLVLRALCESELPVSLSSFCFSGWDIKLGDEWYGFTAHRQFDDYRLDEATASLVD